MGNVPDPIRTKALAFLRDGRLTVIDATTSQIGGPSSPQALATVRDGRDTMAVERRRDGTCWCECPDGQNTYDAVCTHAYALRLVTGGSA